MARRRRAVSTLIRPTVMLRLSVRTFWKSLRCRESSSLSSTAMAVAASDEVFAHVAAGLEGREFGDVGEARDFVAGLRAWAKENSIKTRDLLHPLRLALTGKNRGPEMAYLFAVLGAEEAREGILRAREARLGA